MNVHSACEVNVLWGTKLLHDILYSCILTCTTDINSRLKLRVPIKVLPRESRALFVLHGVELPGSGTKQNKTIISWVTLNLFASNGFVIRKLILTSIIFTVTTQYTTKW